MTVKPTKKQLEFLSWEFGVFFHFGIRTFYEGHKDWDNKPMDVSSFNPVSLDCEQWIKTIKQAGARYAVLTTKHHEGFANWPSMYTEYSVKNAPWKNGQGDVVKKFTEACRKFGVKVGLYYSPAQWGFQEMSDEEYDDYIINQITELLTNYGQIDYLWFDGCGSENHEYDNDRIISVIRKLQPNILVFSMWDPDVRWVGNEEGYVPLGMKYVVESAKTSINEQETKELSQPKFLPYECDCKIRRYNWFYSDYDLKYLRSVDDLMKLYDYSVGRGGNLLLNVAPDRRGLLPEPDCERLIEFGKRLKDRFSSKVPCEIIKAGNEYTVKFPKEYNISTVVLCENLENGQHITNFKIDYFYYVPITLMEGKTIGHKQICSIGPVFVDDKREIKIIVSSEADSMLDIFVYE